MMFLALLAIGAGFLIFPSIKNGIEDNRLKAEIERVSKVSGINAASVECANVEFAEICYVDYTISWSAAETMLSRSGYAVGRSSVGNLSATNQETSVSVESEKATTGGSITIKYKDINVTL